jgi:carboxymethylenebutenolidase
MGTFESIEAGGTTARVYAAGTHEPGVPGVVVLHPWWGLNEDVITFADRLAGEGFAIAAPDLFNGSVASRVEDAEKLARSADEAAVESLVLATIDWLADRLGPDTKIGLLGFSFGAWWSVASAADRDRVAASVVYYGAVSGPELAGSAAPVLGQFAETDQFESDESIAEMETELRSAGREATIHRYPGTGHWFAEPSRDAYRPDAADLAFERTVAFLREHVGTRAEPARIGQ